MLYYLQEILNYFLLFQDGFLKFFIVPVLILSGVFLSYKIKFFHLTKIAFASKSLFAPTEKKSKKNISSFTAFFAILGGNLGVGNISGTAIALATGGPGSILWMSVVILITSVIKYFSCYLGIKYRIYRKKRFIGGPMYFIKNGMACNSLAVVFCLATIFTAVLGGNLVQVNSLTLPMSYIGINPIYGGLLITIIFGLVILAGVKSFVHVVTSLVPFMAISYLMMCIYIIFLNSQSAIYATQLIFTSALNLDQFQGGILGFAWMKFFSVIQVGASRGIFATDIGFGLEAILHSNVKQSKGHHLPLEVEQGLISVLSPFIVLLLCFITAVVLILTGAWNQGYDSTNMCFEAFKIGFGSDLAGYFLIVILFCFAFTTILTWSFCSDRAVEYIFCHKKSALKIWRVLFVMIMPFGSVFGVYGVWALLDFSSAIMLLANLIALLFLSHEVIKGTKLVAQKIAFTKKQDLHQSAPQL
jgi:AGCS family alanine or glycine:cation symporter